MKKLLAVTALAVLAGATGCSTDDTPAATVTHTVDRVDTTAAAPTTPLHKSWLGSGVFSVGEHPSGGAKASIPPGRYTVELQDGRHFGLWYVCSDLPCSETSNNWLSEGTASGDGFSQVIDIAPSDGAIYGAGVRFVSVEPITAR